MTDMNALTTPRARLTQTMSFGAHRSADRPASALNGGASGMSASWHTNASPSAARNTQHGAPVRNFADVVLDPFRWVMATNLRKYAVAGLATLGALILIF